MSHGCSIVLALPTPLSVIAHGVQAHHAHPPPLLVQRTAVLPKPIIGLLLMGHTRSVPTTTLVGPAIQVLCEILRNRGITPEGKTTTRRNIMSSERVVRIPTHSNTTQSETVEGAERYQGVTPALLDMQMHLYEIGSIALY